MDPPTFKLFTNGDHLFVCSSDGAADGVLPAIANEICSTLYLLATRFTDANAPPLTSTFIGTLSNAVAAHGTPAYFADAGIGALLPIRWVAWVPYGNRRSVP
jgi:hypothetical protein